MAKANGKNKSHSTPFHPPYFEMIADAISSLKERTGSSQAAISKFIEDKHGKVLPPNFLKLLSVQLKKLLKSEKLYKVKNSYKLSPSNKKEHQTSPREKGEKKKVTEKTKRLSLVKTPEALKKKTPNKKKKSAAGGGKMKPLSQVKTPEALKKQKPIRKARK